ncbi:hypothetical protein EJ02DRAFT_430984 [Clathrospora elynae]|uniref:Uncharacterized protein n=1 Tax=Clathrospora elynae TaxID=706981 RepID=A0A6A5T1G0_9PLEO|nr:hypothetical protein EJ02DRAFT_430984 [Clathrospora elynae]
MSTTSSFSQPKRARVFELYCPEIDATVSKCMITPSMTHDEILEQIRRMLPGEETEVFACDINGEPIFDLDTTPFNFNNVVDGEKLLIGTYNYHRIRPKPELEVVLYLEADEADGLPRSLRKLSREDHRIHIRTLRRRDAIDRKNILRLRLPHADIVSALRDLETATPHQMKRKYSRSSSNHIIKDNWYTKAVFMCTQKCLAAIAILSSATCGQDLVCSDALFDAYKARVAGDASQSQGVQEVDVREVIEDFYETADAVGSEGQETEGNTAKGARDAKKQTCAKNKGKEKVVERDAADEEALGEDAFGAARPGTKAMQEVDSLAGRLGKTRLPDNTVAESEDEDDNEGDRVKLPGRTRRT